MNRAFSEVIHEGKNIGERVHDVLFPAFALAKNQTIIRHYLYT